MPTACTVAVTVVRLDPTDLPARDMSFRCVVNHNALSKHSQSRFVWLDFVRMFAFVLELALWRKGDQLGRNARVY